MMQRPQEPEKPETPADRAIDDPALDRSGHLSAWAIDRLALDDRASDPAFFEAAERHLAQCPPCRDVVSAIASAAPSLTMTPPTTSRPERRAAKGRLRAIVGGGLVLAMAAVAFLVTRPADDILAKGADFAFEVHVNDGHTTTVASDGHIVAAGHRAGFKLRAPDAGFVAVVGWDDHQKPYAIYPGALDMPAPALAPTRDATAIPAAVAFDGTGAHETLAALYCQGSFKPAELVGAAVDPGALTTRAQQRGCVVRTLTLVKR